MMKIFRLYAMLLVALIAMIPMMSSCSDDKNDEPTAESPFYGTWVNEKVYSNGESYLTTLVFNKDNSGYIRQEWESGTRAGIKLEMNFDWSATVTSTGTTRLSVIYKSGDRDISPFEGNFAQWNTTCTVAGSTLTVNMKDNTIMIFKKN